VTSYPEEKLWDHINDGRDRMNGSLRRFWDAICVPPEEWRLDAYGQAWIVALIGRRVIYYNHHEHGFNLSPWQIYGVVDRYQSDQYGLEEAVERALEIVRTGEDRGPWSSPPLPGKYAP
jgi:hypothetical protein